nr:MAG TPA: hypothetical protein [Caudoviricetes sp.]
MEASDFMGMSPRTPGRKKIEAATVEIYVYK